MKTALRKHATCHRSTIAALIFATTLSLHSATDGRDSIALPQVIMPAIPDGSNASRAPLPSSRPFQFNRYVTTDGKTSVITVRRIGAPALSKSYATVPPVGTGYARVIETSSAAEVAIVAANGGPPGLTPVGTTRGAPLVEGASATASLDASTMAVAIPAESIVNRASLLDEVESRVNASARALRVSSRPHSSALKTTRASLGASIQAARNATSDTWQDARAELARAYAAYSAAVARQ